MSLSHAMKWEKIYLEKYKILRLVIIKYKYIDKIGINNIPLKKIY